MREPVGTMPVALIDDELSHWEQWIGVPYQGMTGLPPGVPVGDGMTGTPLGLDGLGGVFMVQTVKGEKILRVSGEIYGALTSKRQYADYHLRLQYRWGTRTYPPRTAQQPRDSGLLFHQTGSFEDAHWSVFLTGIELQISQGRTGDLLSMSNKDGTLSPSFLARVGPGKRWEAAAPYERVGGPGQDPIFKHGGDFESAPGDWTTVDLYTVSSTAVYAVNGYVVMAFQDAEIPQSNGPSVPLTHGKIQLQSEGAEVYYKNILIEPIAAIPDEIKAAAGLAGKSP